MAHHLTIGPTLPKTVQNGVTEVKRRGLGTRQANNKNGKTAFLFKNECQKREQPITKSKNRSQKRLKPENRKTQCPSQCCFSIIRQKQRKKALQSAMRKYATTKSCRREVSLRLHFGVSATVTSGHNCCDNCKRVCIDL